MLYKSDRIQRKRVLHLRVFENVISVKGSRSDKALSEEISWQMNLNFNRYKFENELYLELLN